MKAHASGLKGKQMAALVTGGAGFIGFALSKALAEKGYSVTIADNLFRGRKDAEFEELCSRPNVSFINSDLTKPESFPRLGKPDGYDYVYHLAAINGTRLFYEMPEEVLRVNILACINLLDWFKGAKKSKVLFSSSSETYAGTVAMGKAKIPTPETVPLSVQDVKNPRWSYAGSKILGELLFINYARKHGFPFSIVRYHNIYGPRMGTEHVIPEFILRAGRREDPFTIKGGSQTRAFCFVDDAVRATIAVMESPRASGEIIHIGNDREEIKISNLAKKVFSACGYRPKLKMLPPPKGSVARRCPSTSKLLSLTGFRARVPLGEGLKKTAGWYLEMQRNGKFP